MKTINETFTDGEHEELSNVKDRVGLTWREFILSGNMKTHHRGWIKKHKDCSGLVRYLESLDPNQGEWDAECLACGKMVCEDEIEFERR